MCLGLGRKKVQGGESRKRHLAYDVEVVEVLGLA